MADFDTIVVGAGPAGATAAYWLGQAGQRVLVLERARLPRYKACGGGVPKAALRYLPFDFSPVVECEISRVRFRYTDGREVAAGLPDRPVVMVMRASFDSHILRHAHVEIRDGSPVVELKQDESGVEVATRSGETFRADHLIGADGASSRVARRVGLRKKRRMGVTIELEVPQNGCISPEFQETALFLFGMPYQGYQWVFPKAKHLSVGTGAFFNPAHSLSKALMHEMRKLGIDTAHIPARGHPLPVYTRHEPLQRGRVLLVGDAAGLVDPLLGEGIRHAIHSGKLAAEAILSRTVESYSARVHREIGDNLLWGLLLARLFYRHQWGSFELGVRNPLFLQAFLKLFAGQTTYRTIFANLVPYVVRGLRQRLPVRRIAPSHPGGIQC